MENLAALQRLELLRKFPAKIKENPENHEIFLRSSVCVFVILVRAYSGAIQMNFEPARKSQNFEKMSEMFIS
jgi:hypothetical protein